MHQWRCFSSGKSPLLYQVIFRKGSVETPPCWVRSALWGWRPGRNGHTCHRPTFSISAMQHVPQRTRYTSWWGFQGAIMLCALLSHGCPVGGCYHTHLFCSQPSDVVWNFSIIRQCEKNHYLIRKKNLENDEADNLFIMLSPPPQIFNSSPAHLSTNWLTFPTLGPNLQYPPSSLMKH